MNQILSFLMAKASSLYSLLTSPKTIGVRIVVTNPQNQVLLVKHTYVPDWYFPGGGVQTYEAPFEAACRELREEVGIEKKDLNIVCAELNHFYSRRDYEIVYHAKVAEAPEFKPSFEIAEAKWFDVDDLPEDTSPLTLKIIKTYFV